MTDLADAYATYDEATAARDACVDEHSEALKTWQAYERTRLGDAFAPDPAIEIAGIAARDALGVALDGVALAEKALVEAILAAIVEMDDVEGVVVRTPYSPDPLTIVSVLTPAWDPAQIVEVLFTEDGGPIETRAHSWDLDESGDPIHDIADDEAVPYERWGPQGLRVRGTVHPRSRRLVETSA